MGAFFTNVQVFLGDRDPEEARPALAEAVRAEATGAGFVEVDAGSEADRTVIIGPARGRFVTVYDEATEDQDLARLEALAMHLSRALATTAVGVLVHDSDVLELRLARLGERAAAWSSWPDYFGDQPPGPKKRTAPAGDPAPFHELLAPGRTAEELAAALGSKPLFAEATLAAVAEILGMDPAASALGHRYLTQVPGGAEGGLELRFRATERPAYELEAEGPPAFTLGGHSPRQELSEGDPLCVAVQMQSAGRASRGLLVSVWGSALDRGLVEATRVRLVIGRSPEKRTAEAPLEDGASGATRLRFARFADLEIPAGLGGSGFPDLARGGNVRRAIEAWADRHLHVFVEGAVKRAGEGALGIGVVPHENAETGAAGHETALVIHGVARRPLRAAPSVASHLLRPLATPAKLFAFVSLGAPPETSAAVAASAIERWAAQLAERGQGRYQTVIFDADPTTRPKTGSRKSAGLFAGKWWKDLRAALPTYRAFSASLVRGEEASPGAAAGGFSLEKALFPNPVKDDAPLPHLGLWMDLAGVPDAEARAREAWLVSLVDEVMERGEGLQALVGRWGSEPSGAYTVYEQACGVGGTITVYRSWCARFLRGVSERALWLGPELLERLGETRALAELATVTRVGRGVRVELGDAARLDALEETLAPLLPDAATWQEAVMRLYAPRG